MVTVVRPYQPVDEVLNWPSTHNMSRPKLQVTTLCSGLIAEQRLRQRAAKVSDVLIANARVVAPAVGKDDDVIRFTFEMPEQDIELADGQGRSAGIGGRQPVNASISAAEYERPSSCASEYGTPFSRYSRKARWYSIGNVTSGNGLSGRGNA